jgi:hypothetical protein
VLLEPSLPSLPAKDRKLMPKHKNLTAPEQDDELQTAANNHVQD